MQRLTLCMIVKNEEAFLEGCLASVRDVVDAIVMLCAWVMPFAIEYIATQANNTWTTGRFDRNFMKQALL